jgi:hypothetical protein
MSLEISDDLRQALVSAGTPLRLVDSQSGQAYVVVRESAYAKVQSLLGERFVGNLFRSNRVGKARGMG